MKRSDNDRTPNKWGFLTAVTGCEQTRDLNGQDVCRKVRNDVSHGLAES